MKRLLAFYTKVRDVINKMIRSVNLMRHYCSLRNLNRQSTKNAEAAFKELSAYVSSLDPVKLLSQLTLTFQFMPEDSFVSERNFDIHEWMRWTEFLGGYLASREYPLSAEIRIDGRQLEKIEDLLKKYFTSISTSLISAGPRGGVDGKMDQVIHSAKLYSLFIRSETYPFRFLALADDLYSRHDAWFRKKFGFTIKDAIRLTNAIMEEYSRRYNDHKRQSQAKARAFADLRIRGGFAQEKDRENIETQAAGALFFGNSDSILSFTSEELSKFSGLPQDICRGFLNRMSQHFGYKNSKFPNVFEDPLTAPWDYNTLNERPILKHNDKYFVPLGSLFSSVLFNTVHYDLLSDAAYRVTYNKDRGIWLEEKTAECFRRIFPTTEVMLNPKFPNGEELCDVIVLHDRKIFIVQCKSKRLRYESEMGKSYPMLKEDIEKGIKESFDQAVRVRDYLNGADTPKVLLEDGEIVIDGKQVSDIFLMSVTLGSYQMLTTRLANINPALQLFTGKQYPWAISLFDLEVICEIIESPAVFIHYARRRLLVEQTAFELQNDEIDLLGFYFTQGLYFETPEFQQYTGVTLSGYSEEIDDYMQKTYELNQKVPKPMQKLPEGFEDFLGDIERLESSYKTDCAIRLLDLSYNARESFINMAEQARQRTRQDGKVHDFSTSPTEHNVGYTFISMDVGGDTDRLFKQAWTHSVLKKYSTKAEEWVCFGWDRKSQKTVDVAIFLSYPWAVDPVIEEMAKKHIKPGIIVELEKPK